MIAFHAVAALLLTLVSLSSCKDVRVFSDIGRSWEKVNATFDGGESTYRCQNNDGKGGDINNGNFENQIKTTDALNAGIEVCDNAIRESSKSGGKEYINEDSVKGNARVRIWGDVSSLNRTECVGLVNQVVQSCVEPRENFADFGKSPHNMAGFVTILMSETRSDGSSKSFEIDVASKKL
ncbi:MAG: hypothetical protein M1825_003027 [Sarcosagium campestre]|nr:MAG: hypothetical protein M1825_003027 [Sarcosagium campestre]